jgi:adenosylcobinamide-GDP ribazoletransferase
MFKSFSGALSFLTVFRIPFADPVLSAKELAAGFSCFPLIGLILGCIYYCAAHFLSRWVPALLLAVMIASLTVFLTRGLHLDGLADLADGIWGGATPERRLEIMKDSRSGAFGVLALVLAVSFKIASIQTLLQAGNLAPLLLAPVFSRFAMAAAAFSGIYARKEGLGKSFVDEIRVEHLGLAALFTAAAAIPAGVYTVLYFVPVLGCVFLFRTMSRRYLGGITGDVLGAVSEASEIIVLVIGACLASA